MLIKLINEGEIATDDTFPRVWSRIIGREVSISDALDMKMSTAGMPTDPDYFVQAVHDFYSFVREHSTKSRFLNGLDKYTFSSAETARQCYELACRVAKY